MSRATSDRNIIHALQSLEKRAERATDSQLVATYVEMGPVLAALRNPDNAILFGRRGTGKTHTLKYLAEQVRVGGHVALYIDLSRLGSTSSLYGDPLIPLAERATRLLVDVMNEIHSGLLDACLELGCAADLGPLLDELAASVNEVVVKGKVEREETRESTRTGSDGLTVKISSSPEVVLSDERSDAFNTSVRRHESGVSSHRMHLGAAAGRMERIVNGIPVDRIWIMFDEWSSLPQDTQPLLADMLRRTLLTMRKVSLKIAAVAHRCRFINYLEGGEYQGFEVGADIFANLDLDEFVVFASRTRVEREDAAVEFFRELLFRHVQAVVGEDVLRSSDQLVARVFTQASALKELVRAAEGVPRDAISIATRAALRVPDGGRIATDDVRDAAEAVFQQVKSSSLNAAPFARELLTKLLDEVIGQKRARAFLLEQSQTEHPLIQQLIDSRILHVIKKGYSGQDQPGVRFDVVQIDYGCYVDLLKTSRAPLSLLGGHDSVAFDSDDLTYAALYQGVDVPEDDYRAIRRAILKLPATLKAIGWHQQEVLALRA